MGFALFLFLNLTIVVLYLLELICWKNLKKPEECELVLQYCVHSLMRHSDEHSEDQNPDRNTDREDQTQDVSGSDTDSFR